MGQCPKELRDLKTITTHHVYKLDLSLVILHLYKNTLLSSYMYDGSFYIKPV